MSHRDRMLAAKAARLGISLDELRRRIAVEQADLDHRRRCHYDRDLQREVLVRRVVAKGNHLSWIR